MGKTIISIIDAIGSNGELEKDNKLLWRIPEDLKRFKQLTQNHAVIMGRKTFESIGKPLPNRINIVVTRDIEKARRRIFSSASPPKGGAPKRLTQKQASSLSSGGKIAFASPSLIICSSFETAIGLAQNSRIYHLSSIINDEIFVIGGGQIYEQGIQYADKLYLTIVEGIYEADTFFPDYSVFKNVVHKETRKADGYTFIFLDLEK